MRLSCIFNYAIPLVDTVPPSSSFETADLQSQTRSTSKCLVLSLPVPFLRSTISPWEPWILLNGLGDAATKPFRNKDRQAVRTLLLKAVRHTTHHTSTTYHEMPKISRNSDAEHPKRVRNFFLQGTKNAAGSTSQKHTKRQDVALNLKPSTSTTYSPLPDYIYYYTR